MATPETLLLKYVDQLVLENEWSDVHEYLVRSRVKTLQKFAGRWLTIRDLEADLINRYLLHLKEQELRPNTIKSHRRHLLLVWRAAARDDLASFPDSHKIRNPRATVTVPMAWSVDEVRQLVDEAERIPEEKMIGQIPEFRFWPAIICVAYDTGLRLGDVLSLKHEDITTGPRRIVMNKTGFPINVRVHKSTFNRVGATFPPLRETIFPWPWKRRQFYERFKGLVISAGLKGTFKRLRCTSGSYVDAIQSGAGSKHLGHRVGYVFARHYEDTSISGHTGPLPPDLGGAS